MIYQKQGGIIVHFSDTFKQLCRKKGITQKAALEEMGLNRNAVQKWAAGHPSYEAMQKISNYFGVSIDSLVEAQPHTITAAGGSIVVNGTGNTSSTAGAGDHLTEMEREMLRIFRMMDMRRKNIAMSDFYKIEDEIKGG